VTSFGGTAATAPGRRATGGALVSVALGAVLCALAVVPAWWWPLPDGSEVERAWTAGRDWAVWRVDPWWSIAVLFGVAGCLLAALGRPARARLLTSAALALLLSESVAAARGGWRAGGPITTTGSWTWLFQADPEWSRGPTPTLRVTVAAALTGALGLAVWRWHRRDRWGATAVVTAVAVSAVTAGTVVGRTDPAAEDPLVGVTVSHAYSSTIRLSVGDYPAGALPGLPGWAVAATAGVLVLHLVLLRRRPDSERPVAGGSRVRDVTTLVLVGIAAAVVVLGASPWWTEWTALPLTDDPWTAFLWEPSAWWVFGVALGTAGSAIGVWALRVARTPVDGGLRRMGGPALDLAAVASWTGAAIIAAHLVWGLAPSSGLRAAVVVGALLAAQAALVDLLPRTAPVNHHRLVRWSRFPR